MYIWAGLGVLVFQVFLIAALTYLIPGDSEVVELGAPIIVNTIGFIALFVLGIIAAGHSDKARKIAKLHNIKKIPR